MKHLIKMLMLLAVLSSCKKDETTDTIIPNTMTVKSSPTYAVAVEQNVKYCEGLSHQTLNSTSYSIMDLKLDVYKPENNVAAPKVQFNPTYNPFNTGSSSQPSTKSVDKWENLYNGLKSQRSQETELFTSKMTQPSTDIDESPVENVIAEKSPAHYQYKGCYIMTAVKSGLMIVDQHRAHVRILYDKYLEQMKDREVPSQKVLFPETIHLSATEDITLNKIEPEMVKLGFEITALGGASYAINAIPAGIEGLNVVELVHDIIVSAQEKTGDITQETNSALALTLARNAAIPFGQVLSNDEMENIFNSLFASSNPNYTPDGKNILCILKQSEIEHLLG